MKLKLLNPGFYKICALSALFVLIAVGCGKKNDEPVVGVAAVGACQSGYLQTSYGSLPQGNCQPGYAMYNGSCVPGTVSNCVGAVGVSAICQGSCQAGYVQTQMGCLPSAPQNCGGNACAGVIMNQFGTGGTCYPGRSY